MTRVTGSYVNVDGTAASGTVKFSPSAIVVLENDIVVSPVTVELVNGRFSVDLVATDATTPAGWTYKVFERITGKAHRWYSIEVTGETLDMSDAVPVAPVEEVSAFVKHSELPDMDGFVEKTGDTMTGTLTITRPDWNTPGLLIVDESEDQDDFNIYPGGYFEWNLTTYLYANNGRITFSGDIGMDLTESGVILTDRNTLVKYRLLVNDGVLGVEAV